jgi:hypothetical protein
MTEPDRSSLKSSGLTSDSEDFLKQNRMTNEKQNDSNGPEKQKCRFGPFLSAESKSKIDYLIRR